MSKNNEIKAKEQREEGKKPISEKSLAIIITAAILAVILIVSGVILIVQAVQKDKGFDYLKSDLSKYIEFTKDYKNFELNVDIAKPRDVEVDVAILSLLCQDKSEEALHNGALVTSPMDIGVGDIVNIWYRGYLLDEDGEEITLSGLSNFGDKDPASIEIGSNAFPTVGFELGLVGKNTGDYSKFVKITEGKINQDQVAYVSFSRVIGDDTQNKTNHSNVRIDLSDPDIDEEYGAGFKARIMLGNIGDKSDFAVECDGKKYNYYDCTVNFVTECETNPIIVESYFPYDYSTAALRNENVIFEVYVTGAVDYEAPEFTDEFLESKLESEDFGVAREELAKYDGSTLVDKYRAYAKDVMEELYEKEYREMVEQAIWDYYAEIFKALKYPGAKVDEIYDEYIADVDTQFASSGGQVYNSYTGSYNTYSTLDTYAVAYLGLSSNTNWRDYLYGLAESLVKERMVMYYILRTENLIPTTEEFNKEYNETRQEYLDEYIEQYLDYEGKTREDYSDEEYAKFVEARKGEIFSYYDAEHFEETAYYNIVVDRIIDWPDVVTLDERRAYPVSK